jgi:hypothetical protein
VIICLAADDKNPVTVLQGILDQLTKQRCTPEVAELLLTTMTTHFKELEAHHQGVKDVVFMLLFNVTLNVLYCGIAVYLELAMFITCNSG